nr:hypothetical protein [Shouchella clausii]
MEKSIKRIMTIHLQAGKANGAKVGKDLAPMGINILSFCNQYNEITYCFLAKTICRCRKGGRKSRKRGCRVDHTRPATGNR